MTRPFPPLTPDDIDRLARRRAGACGSRPLYFRFFFLSQWFLRDKSPKIHIERNYIRPSMVKLWASERQYWVRKSKNSFPIQNGKIASDTFVGIVYTKCRVLRSQFSTVSPYNFLKTGQKKRGVLLVCKRYIQERLPLVVNLRRTIESS